MVFMLLMCPGIYWSQIIFKFSMNGLGVLEMILDVITIESSPSSPELTKPSEDVQFPLMQDVETFITNLKDTHANTQGLGLAAPQVGKPLKIFILEITKEAIAARRDINKPFPLTVFINASYEGIDAMGTYLDWEGCFSVSSVAGEVPRHKQIKYRYFNEKGEVLSGIASGLLARSIQHEVDHTMGILMIDRFTKDCRQGSHEQVRAWRREEMTESQRIAYDLVMNQRLEK